MVAEKDRLDPQRTCLVFFDTAPYVRDGTFQTELPDKLDMVANWRKQLALARELQMMVAFPQTAQRPDATNYFPRTVDVANDGTPFALGEQRPMSRNTLGAPHIRTIEEIATDPNDYVFWKERWDPWQYTTFELSLRRRRVDTIIANGGVTEIGIAATVFGAHRLDFDVVVVSDGCYTGHPRRHEVFIQKIFPPMARIRTADEVIAMLAAGAELAARNVPSP
jgi:nicotinamidase-related amidase